MRKATEWNDRYLDVRYKVRQHAVSAYTPYGIWCGYLLLNSQDQPEIMEHRGSLQFSGLFGLVSEQPNAFFDRFDWNGGVTFFTETLRTDGLVMMEIGCDYAHGYDDRHRATLTELSVERDLKAIIDQYRKLYPLPPETTRV